MPTSYSFEQGEALGGPVVYEEPEGSLGYRRTGYVLKAFFWGFWTIFLPLVYIGLLQAPKFNCYDWYSYALLAIIGFMTFYFGLVAFYTVTERNKLTPCRVYRDGFSIGVGESPFHPFSEVFHIEEGKVVGGSTPFTLITFSDGKYVSFTNYPFMSSAELYFGNVEYAQVRDCLLERFRTLPTPRIQWNPEAESFLVSSSNVTGPLKLAAENVAKRHGAQLVDMRFLSAHWREVAKESPPFLNYRFQQAARARFPQR